MIASVAGLTATILAIAVAWDQLNFPIPASTQLVEETVENHADRDEVRFISMEQFEEGTRILTLQLARANLETQIDRVDRKIEATGPNAELREYRRSLERSVEDVKRQINELREEQ